MQGQINTLTERKRALESDINALEGVRAALQERIDKLKDTAAATLVRVQERLDRTLRSVPERTRNEFTAAWSATKGITVEQAIAETKGAGEMSGQTWEEWQKQIAEEKAKKRQKGKTNGTTAC